MVIKSGSLKAGCHLSDPILRPFFVGLQQLLSKSPRSLSERYYGYLSEPIVCYGAFLPKTGSKGRSSAKNVSNCSHATTGYCKKP